MFKNVDPSSDFVKTIDAILETDWLANLSNFSSVIASEVEELNWVGFYLLKENELVLGPFQGKPACIRIPMGKGVCGTAASERRTLAVSDVDRFPGHIACDTASRSEVVIPLIVNGHVIGVLDVDSPRLDRFDDRLVQRLEEAAKFLIARTKWPQNFL